MEKSKVIAVMKERSNKSRLSSVVFISIVLFYNALLLNFNKVNASVYFQVSSLLFISACLISVFIVKFKDLKSNIKDVILFNIIASFSVSSTYFYIVRIFN